VNPDPRALLAGLARRGVRVFLVEDETSFFVAAGPSHFLEDVDRIAIVWAKREIVEALR